MFGRKTVVIVYDGVSDQPTIIEEHDKARDLPPATVWQHPERRSRLPVSRRPPAPTAEQAHTLFKRTNGRTESRSGRALFGGRITSDGTIDFLDV